VASSQFTQRVERHVVTLRAVLDQCCIGDGPMETPKRGVGPALAAYRALEARQRRTADTPPLAAVVTAAELFALPPAELPVQIPAILSQPRGSLAQQLEQRYGLGDRPLARRGLYQLLERLSTTPKEALIRVLISQAHCGAASARSPGRYFAASIRGMLVDHGLVPAKGGAV
jgi:hypothetical protein